MNSTTPLDSSGNHGHNRLKIVILIPIIILIFYFVYPLFPRPTNDRDLEYRTSVALGSISLALIMCFDHTGHAPTRVDDLKYLADDYIDISDNRNDLLKQMVTAGTDYWGNRLEIRPLNGRPGQYTLRSLGPDGYSGSDSSDDIVVTYTGEIVEPTLPEAAN